MPRIRSIKPEFYTDPDLGRLSLEARYLYPALWVHADDEGRAAADPRLIKSQAFAFDDKISLRKVDRLLSELESAGKLKRYAVNGINYLFLPNFKVHQRIDRPQPARFPEPPESDPPDDPEEQERSENDRRQEQEDSANDREPFDEDSTNDRGTIDEHSSPDRKGRDRKGSMVPSGPAEPDGAALEAPLKTGTSQEQQLAHRHLTSLKPVVANGGAYDLLHEFKSIWPQAWQEAVENDLNPKAVGINLLGNFIASVTNSEPEWGRAGELVARYGKLALLGIDEAIIANADDPYRYAFRVCQNQAQEHRADAPT